jgi:hypothetical protein
MGDILNSPYSCGLQVQMPCTRIVGSRSRLWQVIVGLDSAESDRDRRSYRTYIDDTAILCESYVDL